MMFANLVSGGQSLRIVDLPVVARGQISRMPHIHRILLENVVRTAGEDAGPAIEALLAWLETGRSEAEIPFLPRRVLMHDTTCGPALTDIAGMRSAVAEAGGDPARLNPVLTVDVSTDHSVAVDVFAAPDARERNIAREFERNAERYRFMKWAAQSLTNVCIHPPGTGIMHTLNLERLATVVSIETRDGVAWAAPDTLIGTDSHTPMINGIGVLAWGVGGLEAETVLFGMPVMIKVPDVVGVRLTGALPAGTTATDLALTVTERLRRIDLQDRYVEFYGPGVSTLSAGERAVVANMTPEFGANSGFFPIDAATLQYLHDTGRDEAAITLVEDYARYQGMWFDPDERPRYADSLTIDLGTIEMSLAGPRRPQDRVKPAGVVAAFQAALKREPVKGDGILAIAAITSCTNTSDPRLLVAAGLVARKARVLGLRPPVWVKTSLAPGSPAAESYLRRSGLLDDLEAVGFGIVGFGCTTCIGNSGPLTPEIDAEIALGSTPVAVLSGNRNFPGRIHSKLDSAFLASPPLTVAFALAGDINRDITRDIIAMTPDGVPVYLTDLWPTGVEVDAALTQAAEPTDYATAYNRAEASPVWQALEAPSTTLFPWDEASTYIRRPPFADFGTKMPEASFDAHPLLVLGDDITTDHISPAGQIPAGGEAGRYLIVKGENPNDLNVFAARRGNWEVMVRGLFTNPSVRNLLGPDIPAGSTIHAGSGETLPLWRAAKQYREAGEAVVVVAGERYGMGSSRDWAAKGAALLGVRAVVANSFERIHRSNLIGMGILPLRLPADVTPQKLALRSGDLVRIEAPLDGIAPRGPVEVVIIRREGNIENFIVTAAIETALEMKLLRAGGTLPVILERAVETSG